MSQDNQQTNQDQNQEGNASGNASNDSVAYETYSRTLNQFKQMQSKYRDLEQKANALEAEKAAAEKAVLEEQGRFKELYENSQKTLQEVEQQRAQEREAMIQYEKLKAFTEEVGQLANSSYSNLIDFSKIPLDASGAVDRETLRAYGKTFREQHPGLFKKKAPDAFVSSNAPNPGAPVATPVNNNKDVSVDDALALYRKARQS